MKILAVNMGSSSFKFQISEMPSEKLIVSGAVERIGLEDGIIKIKYDDKKVKETMHFKTHESAVEEVLKRLRDYKIIEDIEEIRGVGHRIVHGGPEYTQTTLIDEEVLEKLKKIEDLAPLHNPHANKGIKILMNIFCRVPHFVVFDTAFHQTMEKEAYLYALPYHWYEKHKVRKYGFHGNSHRYVSEHCAKLLNKKTCNLIICHLGNGASITAVKDGKSIDTTMGFTPLAGIPMGTRCGNIDPEIIPYIMKKENLSIEEIMHKLNKESGFLGITGLSSDTREIENGFLEGDEMCTLTVNIYARKIAEVIGGYYVLLNGEVDAICFTAGIGENSPVFRKVITDRLSALGIVLDEEKNNVRGKDALITKPESKIKCFVIPTDEEIIIMRDVYNLIKEN